MLNDVIVRICGRIAKEATLKKFDNKEYLTFSVAANLKKDLLNYYDCSVFFNVTTEVCQSLKKGTPIVLEGYLKYDEERKFNPSVQVTYYRIFEKPISTYTQTEQSAQKQQTNFNRELDDELPF